MKVRDIVEKYTYRVEWSEEDATHFARCLEFPSLQAHGETAVAALREMGKAVSASIRWMEEDGDEIPDPLSLKKYRGNLTLRVPPAGIKNWSCNSRRRVSPSTSSFSQSCRLYSGTDEACPCDSLPTAD